MLLCRMKGFTKDASDKSDTPDAPACQGDFVFVLFIA